MIRVFLFFTLLINSKEVIIKLYYISIKVQIICFIDLGGCAMLTQSEIKYRRLMEKAEELFVRRGYKAVTMDEIAKKAGISKMTIYGHFSSKEELFLEVVLSLMDRSYLFIENKIKEISGVLGKIHFLMGFNMETSKDDSLAFYHDVMTLPYVKEKILEEKYRMSKILFEEIINEGVAKGEIRKVNVAFVTDMLIMIIDGFAKKYSNKINNREDRDSIVENFYDFLKYGLLGEKRVE